MSDQTNRYVEFKGKDTEEAIANAAQALNKPAEELKFTIISTGSRGLFGLGGRKASIKVDLSGGPLKSAPDSKPPSAENKKGALRAAAASEEQADERRRGDRRRADENISRRRAAHQPERRKSNRRADDIQAKRTKEKTEVVNPDYKPVVLDWDNLPPAITKPGKDEKLHEGPPDQVMTVAQDVLSEIVQRLPFEAQIKVCRIGERIILEMESQDSAILIGRKGSTLEAMQFLVNKIVSRRMRLNEEREDKADDSRVIVDAENYRARRQQSLLETIQLMADKVRRTGKPLTISNLNAQERRLVHLALQSFEDLTTRSQGTGLIRSLTIMPFKHGK